MVLSMGNTNSASVGGLDGGAEVALLVGEKVGVPTPEVGDNVGGLTSCKYVGSAVSGSAVVGAAVSGSIVVGAAEVGL